MFWQCTCGLKLAYPLPEDNCTVEIPPATGVTLQSLRRRGMEFTRNYIHTNNLEVTCKRCGLRMKFHLTDAPDGGILEV